MYCIAIFAAIFDHEDCRLFGGVKKLGRVWKHPHWSLPYEPNIVKAFQRIVNNNSLVLDIGANVGGYSIMSAIRGAQVLAVEMQPVCVNVMKCLVDLNHVRDRVRILHGFVSTSKKTIMVPSDDCEPMGSPEAVAGRWPVGVLRKKNYALENSKLQAVQSLDLGEQIMRTVDLVKIDTEGCEIDILKSLKKKWSFFESVVVEFQPGAWTFHNVSKQYGIGVLEKFIKQYNIVHLGHNMNAAKRLKHVEFINFIKKQHPHTFEEFLFTKISYPILRKLFLNVDNDAGPTKDTTL